MSFSIFIVPAIVGSVLIMALLKKVRVYEVFAFGAREGFFTVVKIAPYLLTMLFAIDIFRKSGAMDYLIGLMSPLCNLINIPEGVVPMIIIKPLSGSGALGVMTDIMKTYGVDSMEAKIAAVMMGSTETIFYTLSVYFGSCKIKNTRQSLPAALIAHIAGCIAAVYICFLFF